MEKTDRHTLLYAENFLEGSVGNCYIKMDCFGKTSFYTLAGVIIFKSDFIKYNKNLLNFTKFNKNMFKKQATSQLSLFQVERTMNNP